MNNKIRIVKREDQRAPEVKEQEPSTRQSSRDIASTIKLWVSEFQARRRAYENLPKTSTS
jgi:hypothetical protein